MVIFVNCYSLSDFVAESECFCSTTKAYQELQSLRCMLLGTESNYIFSLRREKVFFEVQRDRLFQIYVHLRGEEAFITAKASPFPVKAFIVDASSSSSFIRTEFSIAEAEYSMDQYNGAPCRDYSNPSTGTTDYDGFKECSVNVIR